jgi:hypothetical protein
VKESLTIYMPLGADCYELCHPANEDDFERINVEINGVPRRSGWRPIQMQLLRVDEGRQLITSDSPWLGPHALIFGHNAIEKLEGELLKSGELLPLTCKSADVWIYNPTRVLDALNESASSVLRFEDGRIMMIQRHVFLEEVVRTADVFKIHGLRVSPTFVSHFFVDRWNAAGLTGLEFKKVWSSSQ